MNDKLWSYILCKNGKQKELLHWNIKQLEDAIEDKILGTAEAKKRKRKSQKVKSSKKHTRSLCMYVKEDLLDGNTSSVCGQEFSVLWRYKYFLNQISLKILTTRFH